MIVDNNDVEEIWKQIKIYDKYINYEISSFGRIRNMNNKKILTPYKRKYMYYRFNLFNDIKTISIHNLVATSFIDKPKNLDWILHINGNKCDNRVENLKWVTHSDIIKQSYKNSNRKSKGNIIEQWNCDTDTFIQRFYSLRQAAKAMNIPERYLYDKIDYIELPTGNFYFKYINLTNDLNLNEFIPLKNYSKYLIHRDGRIYNIKNKKMLKISANERGCFVKLNDKNVSLHRLVATQFIPNPLDKIFVKHKDDNKLNNHVNNLEWRNGNELDKYTISIHQYSLDGKYIKTYKSIAEAVNKLQLLYSSRGDISQCCKGNINYVHGYIWRYASDCDTSDIKPVNISKNKKIAVEKIDINTGKILQTFSSLTEAAISMGLNVKNITSISNCCKGRISNAYGYIWKFVK